MTYDETVEEVIDEITECASMAALKAKLTKYETPLLAPLKAPEGKELGWLLFENIGKRGWTPANVSYFESDTIDKLTSFGAQKSTYLLGSSTACMSMCYKGLTLCIRNKPLKAETKHDKRLCFTYACKLCEPFRMLEGCEQTWKITEEHDKWEYLPGVNIKKITRTRFLVDENIVNDGDYPEVDEILKPYMEAASSNSEADDSSEVWKLLQENVKLKDEIFKRDETIKILRNAVLGKAEKPNSVYDEYEVFIKNIDCSVSSCCDGIIESMEEIVVSIGHCGATYQFKFVSQIREYLSKIMFFVNEMEEKIKQVIEHESELKMETDNAVRKIREDMKAGLKLNEY